jgi:hypothetical protein
MGEKPSPNPNPQDPKPADIRPEPNPLPSLVASAFASLLVEAGYIIFELDKALFTQQYHIQMYHILAEA